MAVISPVLVGRMALSHVGTRSNIESLTENTAEAFQVNLWLDPARQQTQEAFDWNFARKRQALALHADAAPEGQWGFRYQYPADCLVLRYLENPTIPFPNASLNPSLVSLAVQGADAVPFTVEDSNNSKSVLTNLEAARAVYTFDQTNLALWSAMAIEGLSYALASKIAYTLTGKRSIAQDMIKLFFAVVRAAQVSGANEQVSAPPRDAEWIRGR